MFLLFDIFKLFCCLFLIYETPCEALLLQSGLSWLNTVHWIALANEKTNMIFNFLFTNNINVWLSASVGTMWTGIKTRQDLYANAQYTEGKASRQPSTSGDHILKRTHRGQYCSYVVCAFPTVWGLEVRSSIRSTTQVMEMTSKQPKNWSTWRHVQSRSKEKKEHKETYLMVQYLWEIPLVSLKPH